MKRVYSNSDPLLTGFVQGALENEGIRSFLRNGWLAGATGELPLPECWPEIWVSDGDHERAMALIASLEDGAAEGPAWDCPHCGERIEPQFDRCWRCGVPRGT